MYRHPLQGLYTLPDIVYMFCPSMGIMDKTLFLSCSRYFPGRRSSVGTS